ncbi:hypothetical protein WEI85_33865 [Actinomycetes bacterium KLBMP 9797]
MGKRRSWPAVVAVLLMLPLTGSAARPAHPSAEAPRSAAGTAPADAAVDRPTLDLAKQLLIRECMARHGFPLWLGAPPPEDEQRMFPYVVDDVDWARRHGFGGDIAAAAEARRRDDPNQRYFEGLPPDRRSAALVALNGARPEGLEARLPSGGVVRRSAEGCRSEAERRLYGDLPAWYRAHRVVANLSIVRSGRVLADPAYAAALPAWARCMRRHGYPVDSPAHLRRTVADRGRDAEVAAAVAEATCATGGLAATARELDARYGAELAQLYRSDIETKRRLELAAAPRARAIVAAAGPTR